MPSSVETSTPPRTPTPIAPYSHIAKVGQFVAISGTAGVDPTTCQFAGPDVAAQTKQILESFRSCSRRRAPTSTTSFTSTSS
jgi:2-iminobutanoate/2-iminopropanoate deaminase